MLRAILHKSMSISLALLVLVSTMSFSLEKHFCGDTLVDVAMFSELDRCGMEMSTDPTTDTGCCSDHLEIITGQDDLTVQKSVDFKLLQLTFLSSFFHTYQSLFNVLPKHTIPFKDYIPPLIVVDITIRDNIFLI